ncbi:MAG: glycosyltransferase [Bacillota bacterium]
MKPDIMMISSVHNWNDTRIFHKETVSLAKKYNVELHAIANFQEKTTEDIKVIGLPKYKKRIFRPLNWVRLFYRIFKSKSEIIHFHDPELMIIGLFFKLFTTKRVVYDIHEDYTKTILNKNWIGPLWFRKKIKKLFSFIEKKASSIFDLNILVLDEWNKKYNNSIVIKNYPIIEDIDFNKINKKDRVVYIGSLGKLRGIEEMIESFNLISNKKVAFDLIGKCSNKNLKSKMMPKIKSNPNINYLGYVPINEAKKYLKEAKLGFCLYTDNKHEENIPVKMYEYLSYGTPVLHSDFDSWENKIGKEGWGVSVDPIDVKAIAKKIDDYFSNNRFDNYFKNCLKYRDKYNWRNEEKKLLKAYNNLLGDDINNVKT